ncbi:hypothetical protein ACFYZ9_09835 [Streptomyces sp. NPDC001691]|uniref:hypothetical protein n=1 Tax=Streptomyces sp. NPDC001691 TaxID=3364600 RepID=UPI0036BA5EE0
MDRGRTRRPGTSRLLVLCAVLFGLFSMHGAPASAAAGCHGETSMTAAMSAPGAMPAAAPMSAGHVMERAARSDVRAAPVASGMSGELCVSTPARERLPLGATGLLAALGLVVLVVWGLGGRRAALLRAARRGPPLTGRSLLLQVCVART